MTGYVMDNAAPKEHQRLQLLEAWADPGTIRHLEALGVARGWRCLEIGAGAGSIAAWLCRRVGPDGSVVATDLDTRLLDGLDASGLEVRRHDIVQDPLVDRGGFDLVHARMVLEHVRDRERALGHMVEALRPGGWLILEDQDISPVLAVSEADSHRARLLMERSTKLVRLLASAGVDLQLGRRLFLELRDRLVDVSAEGRICMVAGGSPLAQFWTMTWESLRAPLVQSGLLSPEEVDDQLALLQDPGFVWQGPAIMAAWGRRPT